MKRLLILLLIVVATMFVISSCEHVHYFDGEWEILKPATCTENGEKVRYCYCGERQTEVIYALGHTEVIDAAVEATCTTAGKTEGKHCSVCNEVTIPQTVVEALGHTEVIDAAVEATCTTAGKTEGKHCSVCGEVLVAQVYDIALGHNYKYKIELNIFTGNFDFVGKCDQPGCLTPELREENVDVTIEEHKADCTTDGYIYVIYMKDGIVYSLTIPTNTKAGHNYDVDNPVRLTNPTWDNDGSAIVTCTNEGCGHTATVVLPKCENDVTVFESEQGTVYYLYTDEIGRAS